MKLNLNTLTKKIGLGYVLILAVFTVSLVVTIKQLEDIEATSNQIKDLRGPTARSSLMLLNGVNHSLAALRGWMLIGNESGGEKFKIERKTAWTDEITKSIDEMNALSTHWTNPENIQRLKIIKALLVEFEHHQTEIEKTANSITNREASRILFVEAAPRATILSTEITKMIEIEKTRKSSDIRKRVLGIMADIRGSLGLSIASIRAFVLSGENKFKIEFEEQWKKNNISFSELSLNKKLLNKEQLLSFEKISIIRDEFSKLPNRIFSIRSSEDWNQAKYLLRKKAAPLAFEIKNILNKMVEDQGDLQTQDYIHVHNQIDGLKWLLFILLLLGILVSIFVSLSSIKGVKDPINDLLRIITGMSKGRFDLSFKENNISEINLLAKSVQTMKDNLLEQNRNLENEKVRLEEEDHLKSNLAVILETLPGHTDLSSFANDLLNHLVPKINGVVGLFFIKDLNVKDLTTDNERETLALLGSYACSEEQGNSKTIHLGKGLAGQCALDQKIRYISEIPDDYISITSSLGETKSKHLVLAPISFEGETLGLLEIASLEEFSIVDKNMINQVLNNVGIILKSVLGRIETERLLESLNTEKEEKEKLADEMILANKDLAAQKMAMDNHSLVSVADIGGNIIYANDKFCSVSGYSREELIGNNHRLLNSGNQPKEYWHEMYLTVSKGNVWHDAVQNIAKDGRAYWVDTTIVPRYGADNKLSGYTSIRTDITHQKEIIDNLAETKIEKEKLADEMILANKDLAAQKMAMDNHSLVSVADIGGNIIYANDKFCSVSGYSREELIGNNHRLLNSGNQSKEYWNEMYLTVSKGGVWHDEVQNIAKDGRAYWVDTTIVPRYGADNKLSGYTSIRTDITHQKEIIDNLAETKKQAEVANNSKTDFLANMSHEIRTPMNGVIGMTNLLLDTPLNNEQYSFAKTVKNSAESLLAIINDILDFSKVEAGKLELEPIDFDMGLLLHESGRALHLHAEEKGLELICPANPVDHQLFTADPGRIRQIINNLVGNAIKFTAEGEVAVHYSVLENIKAQGQTPSRTKLLFEITDTGIGLTEAQQAKLFERFSQADSSTTRKYGGTGLGLSISKQLVELMGGEIGVKSIKDEGSTFWFTLELVDAMTQVPPKKADHLRDQKILAVDDNLTNRKLIGQLLTNWQAEYSLAESAAEALHILRTEASEGHPYDIAILDMQMPEMDGAQLGISIKADSHISNTNLIMLTSQGMRGDAEKFKTAGFDGYLNKPIDQSVLYNTLLQVASITAEDQQLITTHKSIETLRLNARVLVVEDNITNQIVAQYTLARFGIQVDLAANGEEAVHALMDRSYDLVFMDCQMPIMDGFEATKMIRKPESKALNPDIPIVAMTANAMQADRDKCLAAGMSDFISKPVDLTKLQKTLIKWLPEKVSNETDLELDLEHVSEASTQSTEKEADPIFDQAAMSNRLMNDEELIKTVITAFIRDIAEQITLLKSAIENEDCATTATLSHKIKGATINVGGVALSSLANKMEQASKAEELETIHLMLPQLEHNFTLLKTAMEKIL